MNKPRIIFIFLALLTAHSTLAQEVRRQLPSTVDTLRTNYSGNMVTTSERGNQPTTQLSPTTNPLESSPLTLPPVNHLGQPRPTLLHPLFWGGWYDWQLHQGLNVSLGASVFAQFGKNALHKSAGFQQNISLMYAQPVTNRLTVAVGGYLNNVSWASDSWRDAGISAIVGYRFNEHWEAYLYGQKSLTNNYQLSPATLRTFGAASYPYLMTPLYDMGAIGDRIGAAVKYNFNPSFSIQLSVEERWMPEHRLPAPPAQPRQNIR